MAHSRAAAQPQLGDRAEIQKGHNLRPHALEGRHSRVVRTHGFAVRVLSRQSRGCKDVGKSGHECARSQKPQSRCCSTEETSRSLLSLDSTRFSGRTWLMNVLGMGRKGFRSVGRARNREKGRFGFGPKNGVRHGRDGGRGISVGFSAFEAPRSSFSCDPT